jgi:hypothetical protein
MKSGIQCLVKYSQVPSEALKYVMFQHGKIGKNYSIDEDGNKEQDKKRLCPQGFPDLDLSLIYKRQQIPQLGWKLVKPSDFHLLKPLP